MTPELTYLVATCVLSLLMWVPYILGRISAWGLIEAMGYPEREMPQPAWAIRMRKAHSNLTENLLPFAGLVIAANLASLADETTALGAMLFFWARVVHAVVYTLGIPIARTLSFAVGLAGCLLIASVFI